MGSKSSASSSQQVNDQDAILEEIEGVAGVVGRQGSFSADKESTLSGRDTFKVQRATSVNIAQTTPLEVIEAFLDSRDSDRAVLSQSIDAVRDSLARQVPLPQTNLIEKAFPYLAVGAVVFLLTNGGRR